MVWIPAEHSDQENLTWCRLRAVEWGRWPIFLSQAIAPLFLLFLPWYAVVLSTIALNLLWAISIRYRFISLAAAYYGVLVAKLKWVTCPGVAAYLYINGDKLGAAFALFWPLVIFIIGASPATRTGKIQGMFMAKLGYEKTVL